MLEVRGLVKSYKPKKGQPVVAVNNIYLKFPEKGMVFLLGKSGSGKSTMLNLLGGLDVADAGEIIIKGKSSATFKQKDFDSYRNTYLGFIFQEYNILEEFTVGANIALALELQGQKATDEKINHILEMLDLSGYGNRKPNELSGGQKQRVAIARALVKDPEIILADEPTGALDSNTGRQILDILKKLSAEKLVIVVSHDREFAENYADRIIELADGNVISDQEYIDPTDESTSSDQGALTFTEDAILLAPAYHLTEEDRIAINAWIDSKESKEAVSIRTTAKVSENKSNRTSRPTDTNAIYSQTLSDNFHLIKSRLPMKNAFKIGASGLKHKKFRLVMTILLSFTSFTLFGISDTMGCYNFRSSAASSIVDSEITYASFAKSQHHVGDGYSYWGTPDDAMTAEEVAKISADTGIDLNAVYVPYDFDNMFDTQYDTSANFTETEYHIYTPNINGFVEVDEDLLKNANMTLVAGKLPDGSKDEMAISSYLAQTFVIGGYRAPDSTEGIYESISEPSQMVGKILRVAGKDFTITGVVDTGFDISRYTSLTKCDPEDNNLDSLKDYALYAELNSARQYSYISMAMVGDGYTKTLSDVTLLYRHESDSLDFMLEATYSGDNSFAYLDGYNYVELDSIKDKITWIGEEKLSLADNEIVLCDSELTNLLYNLTGEFVDLSTYDFSNLPTLISTIYNYEYDEEVAEEVAAFDGIEYKIVGYYTDEDNTYQQACAVSDDLYALIAQKETSVVSISMAIGAMPQTQKEIANLISYSYNEDEDIRYELQNQVTFELDGLSEVFEFAGKIFFYIGIFFAVFASILMATFIGSSISYKKQEIGILRAIGARGSDVFRIFFSEAFIIACVNFLLAAVSTGALTRAANSMIRSRIGLLISVLNFGPRQVILLFGVSLGVAAIASFLPVNRCARKKPIDAIRNR